MIVLALDTATTDLVAGVVDTRGEPRVLAESVTATRAHNEELVPTVTRLLAEAGVGFADIGAVVVGCGPGPFTGLRVGMATASAFGQALGVPVHGVVTHDAVAKLIDAPVTLVATDARRKEVYWAKYASGERAAGPAVTEPSEVDTADANVVSVPPHLAEQLPASGAEFTYVAPSPLGLVAAADLSSEPAPLVPHYLRRPDAKEPAPAPRSAAIPVVDLGELK
ncbi:tRNA (adenosine(37)-N6)-threonylcarbamoyltransferase complex dimerization subunit type 1 TsaB [Corynebacterium qintianiae]|uniref:tRNA (Adenosine(37)-N6)-threonylcarbamoyltransferase complex dimerization subunit type 1 TsaB n=1 Tax=Corynebacterium qintianiae TaxID=2709392 RepID=A0A7T0KN51_9CORY|nr:tRNA (adenosine(37)-N6)-threonylcarbamoyltransferase complex dimerization subunit type 1 TsaB [Corynebacterium qintianiae]QPK83587.1 tRNA (adenosine(37)-N6)-threonylcarbamoyltransferase complex dimerization subunit type 1 TsaB [Corynebacterium qintianiae]